LHEADRIHREQTGQRRVWAEGKGSHSFRVTEILLAVRTMTFAPYRECP
jgi:hypothetical protein